MKQFILLMAVLGLATTGCTQNRVLGTHARRGGADMKVVQKGLWPALKAKQQNKQIESSDVELAGFLDGRGNNSCDDPCCGDFCESECGCPTDDCCGGCEDACCGDGCELACDDGCAGGCAGGYDGGCYSGDGSCSSNGRCNACGGSGCGLCQRIAGRVACGLCPHSTGYPASYNFAPSPPTGQVAYPYYTVRGPRDFLRNNPPSIGPY